LPFPLFSILLLLALPSQFAAPDHVAESAAPSNLFSAYFAENKLLLLQIRDFPTVANYDAARGAWEHIAWLQPLCPPTKHTPTIDNNSHWIQPLNEGFIYPETGAWQRLEAESGSSSPNHEIVRRQTAHIISYLQTLENALEHQPSSLELIRFLLATEIYRQYNLTLSGHHRLNTDSSLNDFIAFLNGLRDWDEHFNIFTDADHKQLIAAIGICGEEEFECLDRYTLYRDYLRPVYRSLLRDIPVAKFAKEYKVAANSSGELFSESFMAPATVSYSTTISSLGKLLFFDPLLSGNGRRSCASCHQPSKAYTDGRISSMAFDFPNRIKRHAPSLINAITGYGSSGIDLAKPNSGYFIQSVLNHPQEMNVRMDTILHRLTQSTGYRELFSAAFPTAGLDSANVITALEAFIFSLNAVNGSFDRELQASTIPSDSAVIRGYNLFMGEANCGKCHFPPYFDGRKPPFYRERTYQSAGRSTHLTDLGMGEVLKNDQYNYFFRTPGLRNLSYSAPYAHDGYFVTLREFVEDHHKKERLSPAKINDLLHFTLALSDSLKLIDLTEINLPKIDNLPQKKNRRPAGLY